jgi:hypothetical protein
MPVSTHPLDRLINELLWEQFHKPATDRERELVVAAAKAAYATGYDAGITDTNDNTTVRAADEAAEY